jgi:hypothetical protein
MNTKELWEKGNSYGNGSYYQALLPQYVWQGQEDAAHLDVYLSQNLKKKANRALEFGAGTGRGTNILKKYCRAITAIEINKAMSSYFTDSNITLFNEDLNTFIKNRPLGIYDLIFSFWGPYLCEQSTDLLINKINSGTRGIFFHAHRGTIEQKLIRRTLQKFKNPSYNPETNTSINEDNFKRKLDEFEKSKQLEFTVKEVLGSAQFRSIDSAMESFLNFHLGGVFEQGAYFEVSKFLEPLLREHQLASGEISMGAGIKIFDLVKC